MRLFKELTKSQIFEIHNIMLNRMKSEDKCLEALKKTYVKLYESGLEEYSYECIVKNIIESEILQGI